MPKSFREVCGLVFTVVALPLLPHRGLVRTRKIVRIEQSRPKERRNQHRPYQFAPYVMAEQRRAEFYDVAAGAIRSS